MNVAWNEIRELSALMEAEANGHMIDRLQAAKLAQRLSECHPEISATMELICARMLFEPEAAR